MNSSPVVPQGRGLYPWLEPSWSKLRDYVELGRVPHALLIEGPEGVGKSSLALCFANHLLCEKPRDGRFYCGQCAACHLVEAGTHPDLVRIDPPEPGKPITVDRIRELSENSALTVAAQRYRVVVIGHAEQMNLAAANAFLKTLEEPGKGTVMILVSARCWDLPLTIKSRCQSLRVVAAIDQVTKDWLAQRVEPDQVEALLAMACNAPLKALAIAASGKLESRNSAFSWWRDVAAHAADPLKVAEKLAAFPLREVLQWISAWTVDMIRLAMVREVETLHNPDLRALLQDLAGKLELNELIEFYDGLIHASSLINTTVNAQMLLESILIDWYRLKRSD